VIIALVRDRIIDNPRREVAVQGQGKIFVKQDTAQITLSVSVFKKQTPVEAIQEGSERINKIIDTLKSLGIQDKDMQTIAFNLTPEYTYDKGISILSGYSLTQQLKVKIRDIQKLGQIIQDSVSAGANQVSDAEFVVDDLEGARQQARILAVEQVKQKAKAMAASSGIRLGKVVGFWEDTAPTPPLYGGYGGMGGGTVDKVAQSPSTPPGQNEIVVNVSLNYEVK